MTTAPRDRNLPPGGYVHKEPGFLRRALPWLVLAALLAGFGVLVYYAVSNLAASTLQERVIAGPRWFNLVGLALCVLLAVTLPPCMSTRRRTSDRPMPRPPWARMACWSTCLNISKTRSR